MKEAVHPVRTLRTPSDRLLKFLATAAFLAAAKPTNHGHQTSAHHVSVFIKALLAGVLQLCRHNLVFLAARPIAVFW